MDLVRFYAEIGGDSAAARGRFGSDALLEKFILKFGADKSFEELEQALAAGDGETAFRAAHTLKGVCLNLGFGNLYEAVAPLTERLRGRKCDGCEVLFAKVKTEYGRLMKAIGRLG